VLVFTAPLPFYLGGLEFAPLVRLFFLSLLVWGVVWTEGAGGFHTLFALLAAAQLVIGAGLLWAAAALAARALRQRTDTTRAVAVGVMAVALLGFSLRDVYHTPLSSSRPESNLFGLFD
jgi:drug/metabolite transporter (DMT)-like permease